MSYLSSETLFFSPKAFVNTFYSDYNSSYSRCRLTLLAQAFIFFCHEWTIYLGQIPSMTIISLVDGLVIIYFQI
jgi:hypothetical protein